MNQEYVPIESVADKFSVSISTVRSWIKKGFIPRDSYIKAGNTYRFKLDEIESSLRKDKEKDKEDEHWIDLIKSDETYSSTINTLHLDDDY
jgi:DNA-binding transcriptional MerR regulator